MAEDTACQSKKNIDYEAKQAKDLIEKFLKDQNTPQDLELGLQQVKQHLENIEMDGHTGGPMASHIGTA